MKEYFYTLNIKAYMKFGVSLPIPIRNHFYKRRSLAFKYHWFCKDCSDIFNLTPFDKYKGILMSDLCCQHCGSKNIYHSNFLSKAIIDGKSIGELHELCESLQIKH